MLKTEFVYRELLFQALEQGKGGFTQKGLAGKLNVSLANVNNALRPLRRMNAVKVGPMGFSLVNPKKVLFYWASSRNLEKDVVYRTRVDLGVAEIEKRMASDVIFGAYSGYKFRFKDVPADYSEVYVYAEDLEEMRKRFPEGKGNANLVVLQKDEVMEGYGRTGSIGQLFVDLWNLPEWYASDFLKELEVRIDAILE